MEKILAVILFIFAAQAHADVSLGTDASSGLETSHSTSIKRDKSLTVDKGKGKRKADSNSKDHAAEQTHSKSHQAKQSASTDQSKNFSADVNINGMLLQEFMRRYERTASGVGAAGAYFNKCKPLLRLKVDYPVILYSPEHLLIPRNAGLGAQTNGHKVFHGTAYEHLKFGLDFVSNPEFFEDYIECRVAASFYIAKVGEKLSAATVQSRQEIQQKIQYIFMSLDYNKDVWRDVVQHTVNVYKDGQCTQFLSDFSHSETPNIDCGTYSYIGDDFEVENRQTLSKDAINGETYKIAISQSNSASSSVDDTASDDSSHSDSERTSSSSESYVEDKKSANMSVSSSSDDSTSEQTSSGSKSDMSASPR